MSETPRSGSTVVLNIDDVLSLPVRTNPKEIARLRQQLNAMRQRGFQILLVTSKRVVERDSTPANASVDPGRCFWDEIDALGCARSELQSGCPVESAGAVLLDDKAITIEEFCAASFSHLVHRASQPHAFFAQKHGRKEGLPK